MRDQIEPDNYLQIAEGIIQRLEERCKEMGATSLTKLNYLMWADLCLNKEVWV